MSDQNLLVFALFDPCVVLMISYEGGDSWKLPWQKKTTMNRAANFIEILTLTSILLKTSQLQIIWHSLRTDEGEKCYRSNFEHSGRFFWQSFEQTTFARCCMWNRGLVHSLKGKGQDGTFRKKDENGLNSWKRIVGCLSLCILT